MKFILLYKLKVTVLRQGDKIGDSFIAGFGQSHELISWTNIVSIYLNFETVPKEYITKTVKTSSQNIK